MQTNSDANMNKANNEAISQAITATIIDTINKRMNELQRLSVLQCKDVLTMDDVCLLTNLTKSYVYKLVCFKKIPFYKGGNGKKLTYFKKSEIADWLLKERHQTVEEINEAAVAYVASHPVQKGGRA